MNRFKSLKTKLIVCTTAIVCVTAVLNLIIGIMASTKSITENVQNDLHSIGTMAETAIDSSLNKMKLGIQFVAKTDLIGNPDYISSYWLSELDKQKKRLGMTA